MLERSGAESDARNVHREVGTAGYIIAFFECLRTIDWFTDLLKVTVNGPAAKSCDMYAWAVVSLCVASFMVAQKVFDQICVLLTARGGISNAGPFFCTLAVFLSPLAIPFLPLTLASFMIYRMKKKHFRDLSITAADPVIFAQRPVSTFMLSLPFSSMFGSCTVDSALVLHPLQVHMRLMQNVIHTILQDCMDGIVDIVVILNADDLLSIPRDVRGTDRLNYTHDKKFFYLSFGFSLFHILMVCFMTVKEAQDHENQHSDVRSPKRENTLPAKLVGAPYKDSHDDRGGAGYDQQGYRDPSPAARSPSTGSRGYGEQGPYAPEGSSGSRWSNSGGATNSPSSRGLVLPPAGNAQTGAARGGQQPWGDTE